jgi:hypothetical protein
MRIKDTRMLAIACLALATQAAAQSSVEPVLTGVHNPRGIAVGPAGRVFVAEAGTGIPGSGRISEWWHGAGRVAAGGLESVVSDEGPVAGPVGIGVTGLGQIFFTYGGGAAAGSQMGTLQRAAPKVKAIADIRAYDSAHPEPTAGPPTSDANPYAVAPLGDGDVLVADAAANNLKYVTAHGAIFVVARFPNKLVPAPDFLGLPAGTVIPAQPVPTSVAVGPDGWWYVGELTGFPFTVGASRVWKIRPGSMDVACDPLAGAGAACQLAAQGFTAVVGLAFGPDGSLYVSEMAKNGLLGVLVLGGGDPTGALVRIAPNGTRSEIAAGELTLPGGVAVANDGVVFVVNGSVFPNDGEVLRIEP